MSGVNTLTRQGERLLGAMRINLELLGELAKTAPGDVAIITASLVKHLRSAWPTIATEAPSIEMPVVESPLVASLEPIADVSRSLNEDRRYQLHHAVIEGQNYVSVGMSDGFETTNVIMEIAPAEQFHRDFGSVLAAARGGR